MGDDRFYRGQDELGREVDFAPWKLGIELHRSRGVFEFLEPVTLTATLTNTSLHPQIVDEAVLEDGDNFALLIAQDECEAARLWRPFVQHCFLATPRVLEPGGSVKATFFVSAGLDGWYLAEPGRYTLQAVLRTPEFVIAAEPQRIRIAHSCSWDEEVAAQDLFTKDVGRAFAFGASHGIDSSGRDAPWSSGPVAAASGFPSRSACACSALDARSPGPSRGGGRSRFRSGRSESGRSSTALRAGFVRRSGRGGPLFRHNEIRRSIARLFCVAGRKWTPHCVKITEN